MQNSHKDGVTIMELLGISLHSYFICAVIIGAFLFYAQDDVPMEFTAIGVIASILIYFHFFPVLNDSGQDILPSSEILAGFANSALLSVLALLIVGQGVAKSGVLDFISHKVLALSMGKFWLAMLITLLTVLLISGFLNNIPVVIIFIPVMQSIAQRFQMPASKVLMPLSFISVVGGMTTLVGSGTNLLVSNALFDAGFPALGFFEFTVPALVLAAAVLAYVMLVAPRFLPSRTNLSHRVRERSGSYFLAEIEVAEGSKLISQKISDSDLGQFEDLKPRMLLRLGKTYLAPFKGMQYRKGDIISVAASRASLTNVIKSDLNLKLARGFKASSHTQKMSDQIIVEMVVTPSSSLIGQRVGDSGFERLHNCRVLGFQHHAHMVRSRLDRMKLAAGDMLLVRCDAETIRNLRDDPDIVLVEYSVEELPNRRLRVRAVSIFLAVVLSVSLNILPIIIASFFGAMAMVAFNVLTLRHAVRSVDVKIVTTIAAALAIGAAMQATGTASLFADAILWSTGTASPTVVLSIFFLVVAVMSNVISTKTCAVLFAPIGLQIGATIGVDPRVFAITIVFAANCAFATPFAYQTSLLVMGPGSYKFTDFLRVGAPLVLLIWLVYTAFVPWYFSV